MFCGEVPCECEGSKKSKPKKKAGESKPKAVRKAKPRAEELSGVIPDDGKAAVVPPRRPGLDSRGDDADISRAVRTFDWLGLLGRTEVLRLANVINRSKPSGRLANDPAEQSSEGGDDDRD